MKMGKNGKKVKKNQKMSRFLLHFNLLQFPHFLFLRELFGSHLDEVGHVMKM
jgi:hypothetical protein